MAQSDLRYAGDYNFDKCEILTTSGNRFDITQLVESITIYEHIFDETISGSIALKDTTNLVENAPIIGQEKLFLKISTPQSEPNEDTIIDYSKQPLDIYKINLQYGTNEGATLIGLDFTTQEIHRNNISRVSQSYKGQPWEIVKKVLRDPNYLNSTTRFFYEETSNLIKLIAPNIPPLDLIDHILARCNSKQHGQSPSYLFYETTKGFHMRSVDGLCSQEPIYYYKENVPNQLDDKGVINAATNLQTIHGFELVPTTDIEAQLEDGMFSSRLISHDFYKKSVSGFLYDYIDMYNNDIHLESNPLISSSIEKTKDAKLFVTNTSSGTIFNEGTNYPYESDSQIKNLQRNASRMTQLDFGITLNMTVPGNTFLQAGDVIDCAIKGSSTLSTDSPQISKLAGRYLIKSLRHDFNVSSKALHTMRLQVVKDGLASAPPSSSTTMSGAGKSSDIAV